MNEAFVSYLMNLMSWFCNWALSFCCLPQVSSRYKTRYEGTRLYTKQLLGRSKNTPWMNITISSWLMHSAFEILSTSYKCSLTCTTTTRVTTSALLPLPPVAGSRPMGGAHRVLLPAASCTSFLYEPCWSQILHFNWNHLHQFTPSTFQVDDWQIWASCTEVR